MLELWSVVLLGSAAVGVLLFQGLAILFASQMPRLDPAPADTTPRACPTISVVVAARNEEDDLPHTLDTLLAQDYPQLEIVVVENGSTDHTRAVIDARAPRVRRVDPPPLPPGWVGKNWACWTGAQATSGEWLLFLDADVSTHPAAVRTTWAWAEQEQADLTTLGPRIEMKGFWERVVLPFYIQMVLTYFRAPHVNRPNSRSAMANGQYWLVRRATYEKLGGHQAVRSQVLEDVSIARRFRAAGLRIRVCWAPSLAVTRMYRDRHEMFEGLLKNVHGESFSAVRQVGFLVALFGLFLLPLALLPFAIAVGNLWLAALGAALYVALFGKHTMFARAVGGSSASGLLYPIAVGFYLVLVATSLARGLRKQPVAWKGRTYSVRG